MNSSDSNNEDLGIESKNVISEDVNPDDPDGRRVKHSGITSTPQGDSFRLFGRRKPMLTASFHKQLTRARLAYLIVFGVFLLQGIALLGIARHWWDVDQYKDIALSFNGILALAAGAVAYFFKEGNSG